MSKLTNETLTVCSEPIEFANALKDIDQLIEVVATYCHIDPSTPGWLVDHCEAQKVSTTEDIGFALRKPEHLKEIVNACTDFWGSDVLNEIIVKFRTVPAF
jgi:hypothetical protein